MPVINFKTSLMKRQKKRLWPFLVCFALIAMGVFFMLTRKKPETANEKARQICRQLVSDLQSDTLNLQKVIFSATKLIDKNDSLILITEDTTGIFDSKNLKQLVAENHYSKKFYASKKAITTISYNLQLKQFAKTKLSGYITDYQNSIDSLNALQDIQAIDLNADVKGFYQKYFAATNTNQNMDAITSNTKNIVHVTADDIADLNAQASLLQDFNGQLILHSQKAKRKAVVLMDYVKKEFHL